MLREFSICRLISKVEATANWPLLRLAFVGVCSILSATSLVMIAEAQTAQPATTTYRMRVEMGFRATLVQGQLAPDGSRVEVRRRRNPTSSRPDPAGPCAEATTQGGQAEITVVISNDCQQGDDVGILLFFPGQIGVTASSSPPIQWETESANVVIGTVVLPIPPVDGGFSSTPSEVRPPVTGGAGLK